MDAIREGNSVMYAEKQRADGEFSDFIDVRRPSIQPTSSFTN